MSSSNEHRFPEELLEEAAQWVVSIDERPLSEDEKKRFRDWVLESDSHRLAFQQVASIWGRMDILEGLSELFPADSSLEPPRRSGHRNAFRLAYAGAGIAAAALAAVLYLGNIAKLEQDTVPSSEKVYLTRVGETATIDLDDGSTIVANTDSRLSVEYTVAERRVTLERGEAFFEVEHDPSRVFSVIVGDTIVRAVGTAFSVHRDGTTVEVLVSEGRVEVLQNQSTSVSELAAPGADEKHIVDVGQLAEFGMSEMRVESIETDEIARRLFWRQGMLAFEGQPLEQVIEEFSRYTTVEIQIASDELRGIRVGGYFDSNDLAGMLTALQSNFGVEVTYLGPDEVLLSSAR